MLMSMPKRHLTLVEEDKRCRSHLGRHRYDTAGMWKLEPASIAKTQHQSMSLASAVSLVVVAGF
jgi:hypothetical protein